MENSYYNMSATPHSDSCGAVLQLFTSSRVSLVPAHSFYCLCIRDFTRVEVAPNHEFGAETLETRDFSSYLTLKGSTNFIG